ncbi:DUF5131 family protein [Enterococcus asini]|uniref:DUF5131 family protein n=1 Tax=Enterococcus asini TaxID=57732 RepID=UPI0022E95CD6|nr:phage Gp37/Gp68 family protein [Enterococcus asini]
MNVLNSTSIEWTDATWNPVTGCTKVSTGCAHCYAERMAKRLTAMGNPRYANGFKVTMHPDLINQPLKKKKESMVFVCSMSDLFHEDVSDEFIKSVFVTMNKAHWHTFQVLTKRPDRLNKMSPDLKFSDNIWIGTSIENERFLSRIDLIRDLPAKVKFLSCEPLLGTLKKMNLTGIDWVVVGGESGPGARSIEIEWVREIRDLCSNFETKFFFKQWGGWNKKKNGRELDGRIYNEMPECFKK